jgi:hypothetical protein
MARNNVCCSVCGSFGHVARGGRCSKAHLARRAVLAGMSQADAARMLGISFASVSDAMERMRNRRGNTPGTDVQIEEHW